MQVILLEKVHNLGNLGDVVKVKDGYARNFLIPTRLRRATEAAIKVRGAPRRTREGGRREACHRPGAGRTMNSRTVHHAEGGCGRPVVRLGDQPRHRRRAEPHRLQGRQGAGAHAQRSALKTVMSTA